MNAAKRQELIKKHYEAVEFFESKLDANPGNARYNNFMASLKTYENSPSSMEEAGYYYRNTLAVQPQNILARNDYALYLAKNGNVKEGIHELNKTMITSEDIPIVRKNIAALYCRTGEYRQALEHATRTIQLNPNDPMSHRNIARIYDEMGDTRAALEHNMKAIALEKMSKSKPHTAAYRAAAVQIISRGGNHEDAQALMSAARKYEGKHIQLPTSQKTYEVINEIMKRRGNKLAEIENEKKAAEAKKNEEDSIRKGHLIAPKK